LFNTDYITICAESGHKPVFKNIAFVGAKYWRISGVTVTPSSAPEYQRNTLIFIDWHNWSGPVTYITVENCYLYSVEDASQWNNSQWDTLSCTAITSEGKHVIIRNNYCKNVNFGITSSGDSCLIEYNTIENFAGDGLRGLGDYNVFQYNVVKNCYAVNSNHDDGFQSWSVNDSGVVAVDTVWGMVLRGNVIINYEDPNQPYKGALQGIGCFGGFYADWIVENNVVIVDNYHGITLSGAINCRIINNTVADIDTLTDMGPYIKIVNHRYGGLSTGCVIRNNIYYSTLIHEGQDHKVDHNLQIKDYQNNYMDFSTFDLRLKKGSAAIDAGSSELAPSIDVRGIARPQGIGWDIGAYEYFEDSQVDGEVDIPRISNLSQNYPNPFNPRTKITYTVVETRQAVFLRVYDILGREIATLVDDIQPAGTYAVEWDGTNSAGQHVSSGIYFYQLKTSSGYSATKKMLLLK
ncbi:MAG TPA: choice-of-anchor Q domain-containing protein, partial [Bacteroidota bacterium]|nr:choice-of-anchor Q domain-containing protein [Bacteroidota bacterium]